MILNKLRSRAEQVTGTDHEYPCFRARGFAVRRARLVRTLGIACFTNIQVQTEERNMKKNSISLIVLILMLFVVNSQPTNAQAKRLKSIPQIFRTFFSKFKSAVEKNSKMRVAAMTLFPFKYGFDAGDEGTMSKAQFLKRFNEIFGESPKHFFKEKNPLFSRGDTGSYVISTDDATHLIFVKQGSSFKFTAYIAEP